MKTLSTIIEKALILRKQLKKMKNISFQFWVQKAQDA